MKISQDAPVSRPLHAKSRNSIRSMARTTFLLGAGLITAALLIGYISYQYSFRMMERSYQNFYLNKAQMIIRSVEPFYAGGDREVLAAIDRSWEAAQNKPPDEYICVVDEKGNLLVHSAAPDTVGNYAGDNLILGNSRTAPGKLCELVVSQRDYVGQYTSSAGHGQIAAFVPIPGRKWMLGVHRSRQALRQEIKDGFLPLISGFLAICGVLMPVSLFLLYKTYRHSQLRQMESQEALEESEQRYQSLVDSMPQCLYRTDPGGRILFANRTLLQSWKTTLEECHGKTFSEFLPPEQARQYTADDLEVIRTGEATDRVCDYRLSQDGTERYIEVVRTPVYTAEGHMDGVQGIFWDVTDRLKAEQQLAHTMAQLNAVIQSVPSGILAVNERQELTMLNQKGSEILGIRPELAMGRLVSEVIPNAEIGRVMSHGSVEFGKPWLFKGKKLLVSRSPIYEEQQVVGGVSVFHDESEMESMQRQLEETRQLNAEFTTLIENLHDGVLITDDEKVLRVNPAFGRISGIPFSSLEGRPLADLEQDRHYFLALVQELHQHVKRLGTSVTLRRKLEGGNEVFITGRPVMDATGKVGRVVVNVRDITELQALEERIKPPYFIAPETLWEKGPGPGYHGIVAESPKTRTLLDLCTRVARVDSTVLLKGESGVGKGVLARMIHRLSQRRDKPFVSISCGAIPENLLESELFGYERGAFSGASREGKPGLFEEADGGIVFLDEIGELPLSLQVKLLTVLQEQRYRRLGSVKDHVLDVQIIAATNRKLEEMVKAGSFREDLYYRLFVVPIEVPPLRERREDIMPLALQYLQGFNRKYGVSRMLGPEVLREMESYDWPGNVRELQNVVERMVVTAGRDVLAPEHLPKSVYQARPSLEAGVSTGLPWGTTLREARDMLEKQLVLQALRKSGNTRDAAKLLGVTHPTIVRKAQKYGLRVESWSENGDKLH